MRINCPPIHAQILWTVFASHFAHFARFNPDCFKFDLTCKRINHHMSARKTRICTVRKCDTKHHSHGYCRVHARHYNLYGDPHTMLLTRGNKGCKVEKCKSVHKGLGYCDIHFRHFKKYGDPLHYEYKPSNGKCKVKYCRGTHNSHGYCSKHSKRFKRHGDPLKLVRNYPKKRK